MMVAILFALLALAGAPRFAVIAASATDPSTASVSCQQSMKPGPFFPSRVWLAMASHTGAHSVPGDDMI